MAKRFAVPFAATGDKQTIPDATDPNGAVSYPEGWGSDYQLPDDDPSYRPVGRPEMNGVLNDITGAIAEIQQNGVAVWVQPAGIIPPYPINALVRYNDRVWLNSVANNSAIPSSANGWTDVFGNGFVPTGSVMMFAMVNAPTGYLVCDGSAINRTTYAALFAAIGTTYGAGNGTTTFNLPDMRAMFPRGLDGGRGRDPGRAMGSSQDPANMAHTHTITVASGGSHNHTLTIPRDLVSGTPQDDAVLGDQIEQGTSTLTTSTGGAHSHTASASSSGATEARPYNVALQFCIKF